METEISNFLFKECKTSIADGLMRFLMKSRAGIQFTPKRKLIFDIREMVYANVGKLDP
jgi:hypothetical protein